jgi:hypothetical protein
MIPKRVLTAVNVALAVGVVAVLLGCGGDSAVPPPGSTEEKLSGEWEGEPLPGTPGAGPTARKLR